jgi:hypothetical protein
MSRARCPNLLAACLLVCAGAAGAQTSTADPPDATRARPLVAAPPSDVVATAPTSEHVDTGEHAPEAAEPEEIGAEAEDATEEPDTGDSSEPIESEEPPAGATPEAPATPDAGSTPADSEATTAAPDAAPPAMTRGPKKQVYGWIEDVLIDPQHALKLPAKLDTGADTTSLDARNIRRSRRDGEDYVRFVVTEPETGQSVELEKPFVRAVRIKGHGNVLARRVVVRMRVCIGDRSRSIEVNLVDRAHFEYPLLLGRNALRDVAVVDPNLRRTREPSCWEAADSWASAPPSDTTESAGGATASCESGPMC